MRPTAGYNWLVGAAHASYSASTLLWDDPTACTVFGDDPGTSRERKMPWIILFVAGLLEVVWALLLKQSEGFSRPGPTIGFLIALFLSMFLRFNEIYRYCRRL